MGVCGVVCIDAPNADTPSTHRSVIMKREAASARILLDLLANEFNTLGLLMIKEPAAITYSTPSTLRLPNRHGQNTGA